MNRLIRKLSDPDFLDYINSYDIVILSETWLSHKSAYNLNIEGYEAVHLYGNKSPQTRRGRYSGGISVYYISYLSSKVYIVEKQQCGIIWLKLCRCLFHFDSDIFLCTTYIPPHDSKLSNQNESDIFEQIEQGIEKYKSQGKVFVTGDLNGRTSHETDYIVFDKYLDNDSAIDLHVYTSDK